MRKGLNTAVGSSLNPATEFGTSLGWRMIGTGLQPEPLAEIARVPAATPTARKDAEFGFPATSILTSHS